ncbi:MAG: DUF1844 domain-containing protein [candidate division NC10 bacterium]|nr:DUF1844 domain-containing protein [candidate division NC10 bacterium]
MKDQEQAMREGRPEASFEALLLMLSSTTLIALGEAPDPLGEKKQDLDQARWAIDLLGLLKGKTRGNLTSQEEGLLDDLLYDLRMRYLTRAGEVKA